MENYYVARSPWLALLVAVRPEPGQSTDPLGLEEALRDRLERVRLGPLTLSALFHLVRERAGHTFPRPTL